MADLPRPFNPTPTDKFTPNPAYVADKKDERNDAVSIEYIRLAVEAMKGREMSPNQIADCADIFWEWSQAETWARGQK